MPYNQFARCLIIQKMNEAIILKRLNREVKAAKDENHFVEQLEREESIVTYDLRIFGPKDSPFENGVYNIRVKVDLTQYPFSPPNVEFLSKIYHPNISGSRICLDVLSDEWSSAMTLFSIVKSLENLLTNPNPDSPLDGQAAEDIYNEDSNYHNRNQELILLNQKMISELEETSK